MQIRLLLVKRSTYTTKLPINIRLHCNEHWCMLMSEFFRAVFAILSCERKCNLVVNLQRKPFNYCSHGKVVCNSVVMDCHPLSGSLAYENVKDFKVIWRTFEHIHAAKLHITFFLVYTALCHPSILDIFYITSIDNTTLVLVFVGRLCVILWYETNFKDPFLLWFNQRRYGI